MYPTANAYCHIVLRRMVQNVSPSKKVTTTTGPPGVLRHPSTNEGHTDTAHWSSGLTKSLLAEGAVAERLSGPPTHWAT